MNKKHKTSKEIVFSQDFTESIARVSCSCFCATNHTKVTYREILLRGDTRLGYTVVLQTALKKIFF